MGKSVVIVANGFTRENVRLQPWRYLYEVARYIAMRRTLVVITEGSSAFEAEEWPEGFTVTRSCGLSVRRQEALRQLIVSYDPQQLWWSVTPRSIAYARLLKSVDCDRYALITCPLYSYGQLFRASLAGVPFNELRALWQQRLIPRWLFTRLLGGGLFRKVFLQSRANLEVLAREGVPERNLVLLRVGIDAADRLPIRNKEVRTEEGMESTGKGREVTLLYFGAVRKIRGFDALVDAFVRVTGQVDYARLVVLARGADERQTVAIEERLQRLGLAERVSVVGGWLSREQVWEHIENCDVVVLPFIIVPSDVPIAILEAMARGKPVIGSPIDGIPELIEGRGLVADPLDSAGLADAIVSLVRNSEQRKRLGSNALAFMQSYPDWREIGEQLLSEVGLV